jgi:hypothetical protein
MIPIYEEGHGKGVGHNFFSFCDRFNSICQEHLANQRAHTFAFIFYDFTNNDLRRILKDRGVFTKLDRLAAARLSIFTFTLELDRP